MLCVLHSVSKTSASRRRRPRKPTPRQAIRLLHTPRHRLRCATNPPSDGFGDGRACRLDEGGEVVGADTGGRTTPVLHSRPDDPNVPASPHAEGAARAAEPKPLNTPAAAGTAANPPTVAAEAGAPELNPPKPECGDCTGSNLTAAMVASLRGGAAATSRHTDERSSIATGAEREDHDSVVRLYKKPNKRARERVRKSEHESRRAEFVSLDRPILSRPVSLVGCSCALTVKVSRNSCSASSRLVPSYMNWRCAGNVSLRRCHHTMKRSADHNSCR